MLLEEPIITLNTQKIKEEVIKPVDYFPEFKEYSLYVGEIDPGNEWWIKKVMRNENVKNAMNAGIDVGKKAGEFALDTAKFVSKQTFRVLGFVFNKIGEALDDKEKSDVYRGNGRKCFGVVKEDNYKQYSMNVNTNQQIYVNTNNNVNNNIIIQDYFENIPYNENGMNCCPGQFGQKNNNNSNNININDYPSFDSVMGDFTHI